MSEVSSFSWRRVFGVLGALAIFTIATPLIANAYVAQLGPQSVKDIPSPFNFPLRRGNVRPEGANANVEAKFAMVANMANTALTAQHRTLWSMYPASVRGRVFGGTGADPLLRGGGSAGW
jgi:hypothetical protein